MLTPLEVDIFTLGQQVMMPFFRLGALFLVMPIFGARTVTPRVRLALALTISITLNPLMPIPTTPMADFSLSLLMMILHELLIGFTIGFMCQILFQVFVLAGQLMALQLGLGFASMNDPTSGVQTTVLSQFYLMMFTLVFLSINGHLTVIEILAGSFKVMPPGAQLFSVDRWQGIFTMMGWLFTASLLLALPIIIALLCVNIAFGVMSRAAPQLNIFALGFPFTLICGVMLIWMGTSHMETAMIDLSEQGLGFIEDFFTQ